jgi:hypothetical protein
VNAFCKAFEKAGFFAERVIEQTARERTPSGGRLRTGKRPLRTNNKRRGSRIKISLGFSRFFYTPFLYCFDFWSQKWLNAANAKSEENPHKHGVKWG